VLIGVLVGLFILLLIAVGLVAYRLASQHNTSNSQRDRGGVSATMTGSPRGAGTGTADPTAGQLVDIDCGKLRGKQYTVVRQALVHADFEVARSDAADTSRPLGEVVDLSPCQARKGDTITVYVSPGRTARPNPTPSPSPHKSDCDINTPIALCASGMPSGPVGPTGH
jgi:hypothetical protein